MASDNGLFDEYFQVATGTAQLSDRRQTVSDLFLGLNSLFLGGMGFVVVNSHPLTWWTAIDCGAITAITLGINITWWRLIHRYKELINLRIRYLVGLEKKLQELEGPNASMTIQVEEGKGRKKTYKEVPITRGIYTVEGRSELYNKGSQAGFFAIERGLALLFIIAYFGVTIGIVVLNVLMMYGVLHAVSLG